MSEPTIIDLIADPDRMATAVRRLTGCLGSDKLPKAFTEDLLLVLSCVSTTQSPANGVGPKERIYDTRLTPLIRAIVAICEREKLQVHIALALDRARGVMVHRDYPIAVATDRPASDAWRDRYSGVALDMQGGITIDGDPSAIQ